MGGTRIGIATKLWVGVALSLLTCSACSNKSDGFEDESPIGQAAKPSVDLTPTTASTISTSLTGVAKFTCVLRDANEPVSLDVTSFVSDKLWAFWGDCEFSRGFRIEYSGEIDAPFEAFMKILTDEILLALPLRDFFPYFGLSLTIDSGGGDVSAAMRIGDAMSRHRWVVAVSPGGQCLSACVFLFAAGAHRVPAGQIGIHRIRLTGSKATSATEMDAELSEAVSRAKLYMARHGVSPRIVEDMMTIPSSEVRMLSHYELEAYGLGFANAVQKDIDRNALIKKCGVSFAAKLMEARSRSAEQCALKTPILSPEAKQACEIALFDINVPGSACNGFDERLLPQTP